MKIIKIANIINVIFSDGIILKLDSKDPKVFEDIYYHQEDEEYIRRIMSPNLTKQIKEVEESREMVNSFHNSKYLTIENNRVYLPTISKLTIPEDLAKQILAAETSNNEALLNSYLNFWTLVSLNPDEAVRKNLFWFLNKYGITLSRSGLFIAYRLVLTKKGGTKIDHTLATFVSCEYAKIRARGESPEDFAVFKLTSGNTLRKVSEPLIDGTMEGNLNTLYNTLVNSIEDAPIYTDQYTQTFNIKIGKIVSMDRSKCDPIQSNTCSSGLHVASKDWLKRNYNFGKVALAVLVNPTDVVAVPPDDGYGKMRVCAYYPISIVGDIREKEDSLKLSNGFEDDFMNKICYTGEKNNIDNDDYHLSIPTIPELNKDNITKRLLEIGRQLNKVVK